MVKTQKVTLKCILVTATEYGKLSKKLICAPRQKMC